MRRLEFRQRQIGERHTALHCTANKATDEFVRGPLQNTTQQPSLTDLSNRATREKLFNAKWTSMEKGDANDTRTIIARQAVIRAEKAKLLGYPNYSAYVLYDQMAKTPAAVEKFLSRAFSIASAAFAPSSSA